MRLDLTKALWIPEEVRQEIRTAVSKRGFDMACVGSVASKELVMRMIRPDPMYREV